MGFIRFLTGIWVKGYLQEQQWLKDRCITKVHLSTSDNSQKPGSWNILQNQETSQKAKSFIFMWLSWSKPLQGSLAVLCFFQAAGSLSIFLTTCLVWMWFSAALLLTLGGRGLVSLVSFRDFLKAFWGVHIDARGPTLINDCFNLGETVTKQMGRVVWS